MLAGCCLHILTCRGDLFATESITLKAPESILSMPWILSMLPRDAWTNKLELLDVTAGKSSFHMKLVEALVMVKAKKRRATRKEKDKQRVSLSAPVRIGMTFGRIFCLAKEDRRSHE